MFMPASRSSWRRWGLLTLGPMVAMMDVLRAKRSSSRMALNLEEGEGATGPSGSAREKQDDGRQDRAAASTGGRTRC